MTLCVVTCNDLRRSPEPNAFGSLLCLSRAKIYSAVALPTSTVHCHPGGTPAHQDLFPSNHYSYTPSPDLSGLSEQMPNVAILHLVEALQAQLQQDVYSLS